jgi:hypothetical protein
MMTVMMQSGLNGKLFRTPVELPKLGVTAANHSIWLVKPGFLCFPGGRLKKTFEKV